MGPIFFVIKPEFWGGSNLMLKNVMVEDFSRDDPGVFQFYQSFGTHFVFFWKSFRILGYLGYIWGIFLGDIWDFGDIWGISGISWFQDLSDRFLDLVGSIDPLLRSLVLWLGFYLK